MSDPYFTPNATWVMWELCFWCYYDFWKILDMWKLCYQKWSSPRTSRKWIFINFKIFLIIKKIVWGKWTFFLYVMSHLGLDPSLEISPRFACGHGYLPTYFDAPTYSCLFVCLLWVFVMEAFVGCFTIKSCTPLSLSLSLSLSWALPIC
jgi:hypothetical protein